MKNKILILVSLQLFFFQSSMADWVYKCTNDYGGKPATVIVSRIQADQYTVLTQVTFAGTPKLRGTYYFDKGTGQSFRYMFEMPVGYTLGATQGVFDGSDMDLQLSTPGNGQSYSCRHSVLIDR